MLVEDVMSSPVVCVAPSTSISEAARLMLSYRISGLPVVKDDGTLVGIVSEGDFLRRSELGTERKRPWWLEFLVGPGKTAEEYMRSHGRKVLEVMSENVVTTRPDASLDEIVEVMGRHGIKRVPVMASGKVMGIVARSDLLRALARALPSSTGVFATDGQLETAILRELANQTWSRNAFIRVRVTDGIAELSGVIFDERERLAARVVAENVTGVKSVSDQLTWIEPISGMVMLPPEDDLSVRDRTRDIIT